MVNIKKTQKLYADAITQNQKGNLRKHLANEKQRFSIRKLTIGAASVLLGTSLMIGANPQIAHADTNTESRLQPDQLAKPASDSNDKAAVSTDISAKQATEQNAASQSEEIKQEITDSQKETINVQDQKTDTGTQAEVKKASDKKRLLQMN